MSDERITTVLAADNRFSRPLAVTVRSIAATLAPGRSADMYLFDMGIDEANKDRIVKAAAHPDIKVIWVTSLREKVAHLPVPWAEFSPAGYARLLIPIILSDVSKALYLDSDLVVRRSVGDLYDVDMRGYAALGVADAASPFVSSTYGVPYWYRFGRRADDVAFNSGVMLMDLDAWRRDDVSGEAFRYLTDGRHQFLVDQEAINAVLPGRIGTIDPRWNQQAEHYQRVHSVTLPYSAEEMERLLADPWIVHFTTPRKPWIHGCDHPRRDEWIARLDQTPYRGWRPTLARHYGGMGVRVTRRQVARVRKLVGRAG